MTLPALLRAHPRDHAAIDAALGLPAMDSAAVTADWAIRWRERFERLADWIAGNVPDVPPEPDLDLVRIGAEAHGKRKRWRAVRRLAYTSDAEMFHDLAIERAPVLRSNESPLVVRHPSRGGDDFVVEVQAPGPRMSRREVARHPDYTTAMRLAAASLDSAGR